MIKNKYLLEKLLGFVEMEFIGRLHWLLVFVVSPVTEF